MIRNGTYTESCFGLPESEIPSWVTNFVWGEDPPPDPDDDPDDPDDPDDDAEDAVLRAKAGDKADKSQDDGGVKELLAAARAERIARKKAERALKARERADAAGELAKKGELEQATTKLAQAEEKAQKLAEGFMTTRLDAAIEREARKLNFIDVDDALRGVNRSEIEAEQDDDDPSSVDIDMASVTKAVKALADRKKHLIKSGTDDDQPSGSSFQGGGRGKPKGQSDREAELKAKYPALNR